MISSYPSIVISYFPVSLKVFLSITIETQQQNDKKKTKNKNWGNYKVSSGSTSVTGLLRNFQIFLMESLILVTRNLSAMCIHTCNVSQNGIL